MRNSIVILFLLLFSCSDKSPKKSEAFKAGFTTLHTVDTSRVYKPNTDTTDYLHFRPLDIDVWYPAVLSETDTGLVVRDLLGLLEQRANYYTASNAGNGLTAQLAQYFSEGFKCSDSAKLLRFRTCSFKNAAAVDGKFPLILYMTAYNGMSYENFYLFQELAKAGFIVASVSSIGRFPGDMTMKKEDLFAQVEDAIVTLNTLKQNRNVDTGKIGIAGYSWGGLAGAVLAGKIANVKCLVSLEGSEFHHYGTAKEEDIDFNTIRNSRDFKNINLAIPYLRLESSGTAGGPRLDSVYDFASNHAGNAQIFSIDSAQHEDFGSFSLVVKKSGNCPINQRYTSAIKLTVAFLKDHLKNGNNFSKTAAEPGIKTIKNNKVNER